MEAVKNRTCVNCLGTLVAIIFCVVLMPANSLADTIAWWQFESGGLTSDSSGNGHTLINTGVTSSVDVSDAASGFSGGSALFDGSASMQTASSLDLSGYSQLTIELFYKSSLTGSFPTMFEHSVNPSANPGGFTTFHNSDTDQLWGGIVGDSGTNIDRVASTPKDAWTHYALQIDLSDASDASAVSVFINGTEVGVSALLSSINDGTDFLDSIMYIGSRAGTSVFYSGLIDELRISSELLDPNDFLIPEPGSLALMGLGVVLILRRRGNN